MAFETDLRPAAHCLDGAGDPAEHDDVAGSERGAGDVLTADPGAVGRAEILDEHLLLHQAEPRVLAREAVVVDDEIGGRDAPHHDPLAGQQWRHRGTVAMVGDQRVPRPLQPALDPLQGQRTRVVCQRRHRPVAPVSEATTARGQIEPT